MINPHPQKKKKKKVQSHVTSLTGASKRSMTSSVWEEIHAIQSDGRESQNKRKTLKNERDRREILDCRGISIKQASIVPLPEES